MLLVLSLACHITPAQRDWRRLDWVDIAASDHWSCGVHADGRVQCWGGPDSDDTGGYDVSPPEGDFVALALAESDYACALDGDSEVQCWGDDVNMPVGTPDGAFTSVSCGTAFCCGSEEGGTACWGVDDGESGDATVAIDRAYDDVAVGAAACGRKKGGAIECWYNNDLSVEDYYLQFAASGYVDVDAYGDNVCAVVEGTGAIECQASTSTYTTWGGLEDIGSGWARVAVSSNGHCGIDAEGAATCVGLAAPPEGVRFAKIDGGDAYACGITTEGAATCWGNSTEDQSYFHP